MEDVFGEEVKDFRKHRFRRYDIGEKVDIIEKFLFTSDALQFESSPHSLSKWEKDESILKEISIRKNMRLDTLKTIVSLRKKRVPFDIMLETFRQLNAGNSVKKTSENVGVSSLTIYHWRKDEKILEVIKDLLGDFSELYPGIPERPIGYWTEETIGDAYDRLKASILKEEGEERAPRWTEFQKKFPGAPKAIIRKIPGVNSYGEYVNRRGDTLFKNYRYTPKSILKELGEYLKGKPAKKLNMNRSLIYHSLENPVMLRYLLRMFDADGLDILDKTDLINSGINEERSDLFINRLVKKGILIKLGKYYTHDKNIIDRIKEIPEESVDEEIKKLRLTALKKKAKEDWSVIRCNEEIPIVTEGESEGRSPNEYNFEGKVYFLEKFLFESPASAFDMDPHMFSEWKKDNQILDEIARKRNISLESVREIAHYRSKQGVPFDKVLNTFELINSGMNKKEAAVKGGISTTTITTLLKKDRIVNVIKEIIGNNPNLGIVYRPPGYWTKEKIDTAYDQLKRKIFEDEGQVRVPTSIEFREEYGGGASAFIYRGSMEGIKNYSQYVSSRKDSPKALYRSQEEKLKIIKKYFEGEKLSKIPVNTPSIDVWLKTPKIMRSALEYVGIGPDTIFNESDIFGPKVKNNRKMSVLKKLLSMGMIFDIGNHYTLNKELANNLTAIWKDKDEKEIALRRNHRMMDGNYSVIPIEYDIEMQSRIRDAKRRPRNGGYTEKTEHECQILTQTERHERVENNNSRLKILGLLHRLEDVGNAYEYETVMDGLGDKFIREYVESAPEYSQFNLAKNLLKAKFGD